MPDNIQNELIDSSVSDGTQEPPALSSNACPVCRKDDRVTRISGLLDSASTKTTGSATTGGAGLGSGGLGVGVALTGFEADSVTKLVERFTPPALPSGKGCLASVLGIVAILGMTGVYASTFGDTNSIGWYILAVIIVVAAVFAYRQMNAPRARRLPVWNDCLQKLRSGYYCARDDVAFSGDGTKADPPEVFVAETFASYFAVE